MGFFSIYCLLILGFLLVLGLAVYAFKRLSRGWSFKLLFKDFRRKMWMTLSLGALFFGLYLLVVSMSVYLVHQRGTNLFFLIYQNPIQFVYAGLGLFACVSLSIYLARMLIKYLYLTCGKDE